MSHRLTLLLLTSWLWILSNGSDLRGAVARMPTAEQSRLASLSSVSIAQAPLGENAGSPILRVGNEGPEVKVLQERLTNAGYYEEPITGFYGDSTTAAVTQFQETNELPVTGKVDLATWDLLQKQLTASPNTSPSNPPSESPADSETNSPSSQPESNSSALSQANQNELIWWLASAVGVIAIAGGVLYTLKRVGSSNSTLSMLQDTASSQETASSKTGPAAIAPTAPPPPPAGVPPHQIKEASLKQPSPNPANLHNHHQASLKSNPKRLPASHKAQTKPHQQSALDASLDSFPSPPATAPLKPNSSQPTSDVGRTTRLSKVNIVDELIKDLDSPDPVKRRKAIWELGQRGHSQAVQPLVNLMMDSDSKQRSLILGALSEIGIRTLKPMNRALAISLQDQNPEVRKNAIRDLTRIYEVVGQISQLLKHAADDPDREVRETAHWALGQLEQTRSSAPALPNYDTSRGFQEYRSPLPQRFDPPIE